jgi:hypothetical protein
MVAARVRQLATRAEYLPVAELCVRCTADGLPDISNIGL